MQQDAAEPLLGFLDTCLPEDRLADPSLAGEDERCRALLDASQKRLDRAELVLAADYLRRHGPPAIVADSGPGYELSVATGTAMAATIRLNGTPARSFASATAASEAPFELAEAGIVAGDDRRAQVSHERAFGAELLRHRAQLSEHADEPAPVEVREVPLDDVDHESRLRLDVLRRNPEVPRIGRTRPPV